MDGMLIWADVPYVVDYVPEGSRNPRFQQVIESVPLMIGVGSLSGAPLVAVAGVDHGIGTGVPALKEFRHNGGLIEQAVTRAGDPMDVSALGTNDKGPYFRWGALGVRYPFGTPYPHNPSGDLPARPVDMAVKRMVTSGRERAIAHAEAMAERTCVLDGQLWVPTGTLAWAAVEAGGDVLVRPVRETDRHKAFLDLESATRHAEWLIGRSRGQVRVQGSITVHREDLFPIHSLRALALRDLDQVESADKGAGFSTLPLPAMEAWCDFRRALAELRAGDDSRLDDAYAGLARMHAALPPPRRGPTDERFADTHLRVRLPESIRYHAEYLGGLPRAPDPSQIDEVDAEALAFGP